jgi:hypothetical protein
MLTRSNAALADTRKRLMCTRLCEPAPALVAASCCQYQLTVSPSRQRWRRPGGPAPCGNRHTAVFRADIPPVRNCGPRSSLQGRCRRRGRSPSASSKTGDSRCRVRQLWLPAVRSARGSFPAAAQERITSIAILPVIVEIFRRLGLSAVAKEPPRVHSVAALLP